MNNNEANELQEQWAKKPCDHQDIIAETESFVEKWRCVQCGGLVDYDEWRSSRSQLSMHEPRLIANW